MRMEVANNVDVVLAESGHAPLESVRRIEIDGVVDTGAAQLVLPGKAAEALGLVEAWSAKVRYADGHTQTRPVVKNVFVRLCGRESVFSAIVEPDRETALIGAIVLEALDLVVDCITQQLHPRDPHGIFAEIE